jgi:5-bromo-4-chloroindolyl phosphate hydrolysis protein
MAKRHCLKETEIEILKQSQSHIKEKVDDIHKILVGNGKKGVINEINQFKGGLRATQLVFALVIMIITIIGALR